MAVRVSSLCLMHTRRDEETETVSARVARRAHEGIVQSKFSFIVNMPWLNSQERGPTSQNEKVCLQLHHRNIPVVTHVSVVPMSEPQYQSVMPIPPPIGFVCAISSHAGSTSSTGKDDLIFFLSFFFCLDAE